MIRELAAKHDKLSVCRGGKWTNESLPDIKTLSTE